MNGLLEFNLPLAWKKAVKQEYIVSESYATTFTKIKRLNSWEWTNENNDENDLMI